MRSGRVLAGDAWDSRLPRFRMVVGNVFAIAAVGGAVVAWLAVASAWRSSQNDGFIGPDGQQLSRFYVFGEILQYSGVESAPVLAVAGMAAIIVIAGAPGPPPLPLAWRRTVFSVGVGAAGMLLVAAVLAFALGLYGSLLVPDETREAYFGVMPVVAGLGRAARAGAEAFLWAGAVLVFIGWWPRDEASEGEEGVAEEQLDELLERERVAETRARAERPSEPEVAEPPVETVDQARLRSDGSSESGYDEFRFRR